MHYPFFPPDLRISSDCEVIGGQLGTPSCQSDMTPP
jgi:hypothetical protein